MYVKISKSSEFLSLIVNLVFIIRDIAKNSLLTWPIFIYWTVLGVYDAIVMFFGVYFLFDNTTFTSNGQVILTPPY